MDKKQRLGRALRVLLPVCPFWLLDLTLRAAKIGRASCRERV